MGRLPSRIARSHDIERRAAKSGATVQPEPQDPGHPLARGRASPTPRLIREQRPGPPARKRLVSRVRAGAAGLAAERECFHAAMPPPQATALATQRSRGPPSSARSLCHGEMRRAPRAPARALREKRAPETAPVPLRRQRGFPTSAIRCRRASGGGAVNRQSGRQRRSALALPFAQIRARGLATKRARRHFRFVAARGAMARRLL